MPITKKKRYDAELILEFGCETPHLGEGSASAARDFPIRTCIVMRERREKPGLLRFVLSPEGQVVADIKGKLPGRGVWVTARKDAVAEAVKRRAFSRAFRKPVAAPGDLAGEVEGLLKRSLLERLSIANKAGLLLAGFTKVEEALKRGRLAALLHAEGAAENGRSKLDRRFRACLGEGGGVPPVNCLTSAEISLAAGSTNVLHAGLMEGGATRAFLEALDRYSRYRTADLPCQGRE